MPSVSVRISHKSGGGGGAAHALRDKTPEYVDQDKSHLNRTVIAMDRSIDELRADVQDFGHGMTGRKWQKNSAAFIDGVITFSRDAVLDDKAALDQAAEQLVKGIIRDHRLRSDAAVYLVRHEDESRPHYHFQLLNQHETGKSARRSFDKYALTRLQDSAGAAFSDLGLSRGIPRKTREEAGESRSAYINRSVTELHDDLPRELEGLRLKISKNTRLADKAKADMEKAKKIGADIAKLEKREAVYLNRAQEAEALFAEKRSLGKSFGSALAHGFSKFTDDRVLEVQRKLDAANLKVKKLESLSADSWTNENKFNKDRRALSSEIDLKSKRISAQVSEIDSLKDTNIQLERKISELNLAESHRADNSPGPGNSPG